MSDITIDDSQTVKISKSVLLEVFALLKQYGDNFVLVGGWAPYFLLGKYRLEEVEFQHIGSADIDIALDPKGIPSLEEVYESIRQKLERNGYQIKKTKSNQAVPYSFEKEVQGTVIHVDFLASEYGGTVTQHGYGDIQDILAIKLRGIDVAFQNNERFKIAGFLPNGARYKVEAKVSGVAALLTMKSIAFESDISRTKDAYDIYSILKYYKKGVTSVIVEVKPYLKNGLVLEATEKLASLFSTVDSIGPVSLANFLLPEFVDSEDWEYLKRDAFELAQEFLKGIRRSPF